MTTKFGFFKEWIQRNTGISDPGTTISVSAISVSSFELRFHIDTNLTGSPSINYIFVGDSSGNASWNNGAYLVSSNSGTVQLDANGEAYVNITINTSYNLGRGDIPFKMVVSNTGGFVLGESPIYKILDVGHFMNASSSLYDSNAGLMEGGDNVAQAFELPVFGRQYLQTTTDKYFKITQFSRDPYTNAIVMPDLYVSLVGGGGAGGTISTGGIARGGGGGGFIDQEILDPSTLTLDTQYNVVIGAGGIRNDRYDYNQYTAGDTSVYFNVTYTANGGYNGNGPSATAGHAGAIVVNGVTTLPSGSPGADISASPFSGGKSKGGAASFNNNGSNAVRSGAETFPGRGAFGTQMLGGSQVNGKFGAGGGSAGQENYPVNPPTIGSFGGDTGGGSGGPNPISATAYTGSGGGGAGSYSGFAIFGGNGASGRATIMWDSSAQYRAFAYVT
jgi:hypothetical protein